MSPQQTGVKKSKRDFEAVNSSVVVQGNIQDKANEIRKSRQQKALAEKRDSSTYVTQ